MLVLTWTKLILRIRLAKRGVVRAYAGSKAGNAAFGPGPGHERPGVFLGLAAASVLTNTMEPISARRSPPGGLWRIGEHARTTSVMSPASPANTHLFESLARPQGRSYSSSA